jgi:dUTP pyrophosphatase
METIISDQVIDTIEFKRVQPEAKLPSRANPGDAGLDLHTIKDAVLEPNVPTRLATGIAAAIPTGHVGLICDRSSMGAKGIRTLGGVVDSGYRGEIQVILINLGKESYQVRHGDKIAQILILPVNLARPIEAAELGSTARAEAGFGSSGR